MNCKPGDLAFITAPYAKVAHGHVVEILRKAFRVEELCGTRFTQAGLMNGWVCEGYVPQQDGPPLKLVVIADECLRPIRDPGADAKDESLAWLPVPFVDEPCYFETQGEQARKAAEEKGVA